MESRITGRKSVLVAAFFLTVGLLLAFSPQVEAYAGPGAGFALVTSFLVVFAAVSMAMLYLTAWPFRLLWRAVRGHRVLSGAQVPRVVVLGLDGLDPRPTLTALRQSGSKVAVPKWPCQAPKDMVS